MENYLSCCQRELYEWFLRIIILLVIITGTRNHPNFLARVLRHFQLLDGFLPAHSEEMLLTTMNALILPFDESGGEYVILPLLKPIYTCFMQYFIRHGFVSWTWQNYLGCKKITNKKKKNRNQWACTWTAVKPKTKTLILLAFT